MSQHVLTEPAWHGQSTATDVVAVARRIAARLGYDGARAARWAAVWSVNAARETWREDDEALAAWVASRECAELVDQ